MTDVNILLCGPKIVGVANKTTRTNLSASIARADKALRRWERHYRKLGQPFPEMPMIDPDYIAETE